MNIKTKKQNKAVLFLPVLGLAALTTGLVIGSAQNTSAATATATTVVTANVGAVVGIGVTDITINMSAPSPSGSFATGTGTVSVSTNDASGYSVYLTSNSTTSTSLDHTSVSGASIASIATNETISGSVTKFSAMNTWGWSNDGEVYHPVTVKGTKSTASIPTLYRRTNAPSTTADNSTLTIGVTGDSTLVSGQYTGTLLLTAIPNSNTAEIANYE